MATYPQPQPMHDSYPYPDYTYGSIPADTFGGGAGGNYIRDVARIVDSITPTDFPFLSMIRKGKPGTQFDVRWLQRVTKPRKFNLSNAIADGTTTAMTVNSTIANILQQYMVFRFTDNGEVAWVRSLDLVNNTLVLDRAQGGTTGAAHIVGTTVQIIGTAVPEQNDFVFSPTPSGSYDYNLYQLFEGGKKGTLAYDVLRDDEYPGDRLDKQQAEEAWYQKGLLEQACIWGVRQAGQPGPDQSSRKPGLMGGILQYSTQNVTDLSGAPLTFGAFELALRNLQDKTDTLPKIFYCNRNDLARIGRLVKSRTATMDTEKVSFNINEIDFSGINIKLMPVREWPEGTIIGMDPGDLELVPKKGLDWHEKELATFGDYRAKTVSGTFTLRAPGESKRIVLKNFSKDWADYPETQFGGPVLIQQS